MAKAYDLSADISFQDAARCVLFAAFRMVQENSDPTREGLRQKDPTPQGIDALHDMRVGTRRLRAALSVFGALFPPEDLARFERRLGKMTDALGTVRDCDVRIETLRRLMDRLPENEAYGISRLIVRTVKERNRRRKALLAALEKWEKERFERQFFKALRRHLPECPDAPKPAADIADGEAA
ncbi:MAG: CHAD domain-containing protein [Capsulimonadales bacterium]|nr:CHAD domain-containing protein [Capsulimonadales bacterium]